MLVKTEIYLYTCEILFTVSNVGRQRGTVAFNCLILAHTGRVTGGEHGAVRLGYFQTWNKPAASPRPVLPAASREEGAAADKVGQRSAALTSYVINISESRA